jgi:hypothetical protein
VVPALERHALLVAKSVGRRVRWCLACSRADGKRQPSLGRVATRRRCAL